MIDAMKQALKIIKNMRSGYGDDYPTEKEQKTITALRQAIEQAEQWDTSDMAHRSGGLSVEQEKLCKYCGGIGRVVCDGKCMPEQEPVAWIQEDRIVPELGYDCTMTREHPKELGYAPVYTAPPRKEWVGLTEEEVGKYSDRLNGGDIAREVEAKLRERNT
jgi:hypothetical protein